MKENRCQNCNKLFRFYLSASKGEFCSHECYWKTKKGKYPVHLKRVFRAEVFCIDCKNKLTHSVKKTKRCMKCYRSFLFKKTGFTGEMPKCRICGIKLKSRYSKQCSTCFYKKNRGINHFAWKGGVTPQDRIQRVIFREKLQKKIFERDGYVCQLCGSGCDLQVDHVKAWSEYPELRFDKSNCRTLCKNCHYYLTFGKQIPDPNLPWGHNLSSLRLGVQGL